MISPQRRQSSASDTFCITPVNYIPIIADLGKERHTLNGPMVTCKGSTCYWNYLEDYWPWAGGLLEVNAIGTHLRDPINSGLARWHMAV